MASATPATSAKVRRQYLNPPVVEAVIRLVLAAPMPWSITTPGLLYDRLRELYPTEPQMRSVMQANLDPGQAGTPGGASFALTSGPQEVVFQTEPGDRLLVVGASNISAHMLPPYEGWEDLEARLYEAVARIGDLLPKDVAIAQLSIRYINRVDIPEAPIHFSDFLTVDFQLPTGFPPVLGGFLDRVELLYADEPTKLAFTWASIEAPAGHSAFVLDLDFTHSPDVLLSIEETRRVLVGLRKETIVFESLLTDRLRGLFGEPDASD